MITYNELYEGLIHANVTASFTIEKMGIKGIEHLEKVEYQKRYERYLEKLNKN